MAISLQSFSGRRRKGMGQPKEHGKQQQPKERDRQRRLERGMRRRQLVRDRQRLLDMETIINEAEISILTKSNYRRLHER